MLDEPDMYNLIQRYAVPFIPDGETKIYHGTPLHVAVQLFGKKAVDYVRDVFPCGISTWTYGNDREIFLNVLGVKLAISYANVQEMRANRQAEKQAKRMQRESSATVLLFPECKIKLERVEKNIDNQIQQGGKGK